MNFRKQNSTFKDALNALKGKQVAVVGHLRPDGDCIGAQIALTRCLRSLGYDAVALNEDEVPDNLKAFVKDTPFVSVRNFKFKNSVCVTVDCSDLQRIGESVQRLFSKVVLNIDHHISNLNFAKYNIVLDKASATCEILAGLFLDNKILVDSVAAQALYVGIATDTGQFRFPTTTKQVFRVCEDLIELGASPKDAAFYLYECQRIEKLYLLREFLQTLKLELDGKLGVGLITQKMYEKTGALKEDTEGFVDYARSIKGVEVGVLLEERPDGGVKGSLRCESDLIRVDLLAKNFNGGGHKCAAGFKVQESLGEFYQKFLETTALHLKKVEVGDKHK